MTLTQIALIAVILINLLMFLVSCNQYSRAKDLEDDVKHLKWLVDRDDQEISGLYKLLGLLSDELDKVKDNKSTVFDLITKCVQEALDKGHEDAEENKVNLVD